MATPNYGYEKRQKELAKKRKKEDKLKQKAEPKGSGEGGSESGQGDDSPESPGMPASNNGTPA